jgi:nucleoside-diphosphate-sugar epimerase
MPDYVISASLTAAERDEVLTAFTTIKQKLPFLIDLTADDRRAMIKMGDKSSAFVAKAFEVANQHPDILPRAFNVEEMKKDIELLQMLQPILMAANQVQDLIEDTYMQVGSEALTAALGVYNYTKNSPAGSALEGVANDLGRRFSRKPRQDAKPE